MILSYVILHELIHYHLDCESYRIQNYKAVLTKGLYPEDEDHELHPPVKDVLQGDLLDRAYGYFGAKALLNQAPGAVETNVDTLLSFILVL